MRCTIDRPGSTVKGLSKSIFVGTRKMVNYARTRASMPRRRRRRRRRAAGRAGWDEVRRRAAGTKLRAGGAVGRR